MKRLLKDYLIVILLFGTAIYLPSCKKEATPPVVTTAIVSNITQTTALGGGTMTDNGYQFPVNSSLGPYKSLVLASNTGYFQLKHDFKPFEQFSQHLSNKSENLLLLDAFGNIIDNVNYSDSFPWPDADGDGYYLELPEASLDNSVFETG